MMRVVVDCRYTKTTRHDGISRYGARLAEHLAQLTPLTMLISDEKQLALLPDLPWVKVSSPLSPRELLVALQVNKLRPDVVFTPMQTMGSLGRRYGLVLTLHDLIYYRQRTPPHDLPWIIRVMWRLYHLAWWPQRVLLNRADEVATVSQTTKRLMEEHRLTSRPIDVIGNAPDETEPAAPRRVPAGRELVYMGSYMPYKNVETLARMMHVLRGYRLHLMSRATDADKARLTALAPGGSLVFHDGASDEEYHRTLQDATALVHASLDEGFGIPLVEAMSLGTPVVVSDIPIFREIGGDAALFAPATDPDAFADAVQKLEDPRRWLAASSASIAQASHYDWDRSAAELLGVLQRVAAKRAARGR